ncbi:MAG: hypothetical protein NTW87_11545 [Planctomycetota bacterium]|nr:hypothetical protein [Planctomycetota bacterium]
MSKPGILNGGTVDMRQSETAHYPARGVQRVQPPPPAPEPGLTSILTRLYKLLRIGSLEIRVKRGKECSSRYVSHEEQIPKLAAWIQKKNREKFHVYFGLQPRFPLQRRAASAEDIIGLSALSLDLDNISPEDAKRLLDAAHWPYTLLTATGGGVQVHTQLSTIVPKAICEKLRLSRISDLWSKKAKDAGLPVDANYLKARQGLTQICRLPGTTNHKYPAEAKIIADKHRSYDLNRLLPGLTRKERALLRAGERHLSLWLELDEDRWLDASDARKWRFGPGCHIKDSTGKGRDSRQTALPHAHCECHINIRTGIERGNHLGSAHGDIEGGPFLPPICHIKSCTGRGERGESGGLPPFGDTPSTQGGTHAVSGAPAGGRRSLPDCSAVRWAFSKCLINKPGQRRKALAKLAGGLKLVAPGLSAPELAKVHHAWYVEFYLPFSQRTSEEESFADLQQAYATDRIAPWHRTKPQHQAPPEETILSIFNSLHRRYGVVVASYEMIGNWLGVHRRQAHRFIERMIQAGTLTLLQPGRRWVGHSGRASVWYIGVPTDEQRAAALNRLAENMAKIAATKKVRAREEEDRIAAELNAESRSKTKDTYMNVVEEVQNECTVESRGDVGQDSPQGGNAAVGPREGPRGSDRKGSAIPPGPAVIHPELDEPVSRTQR